MREKNEQAANLIFKHFNDHRPSNVIDLHGLYVAEALKSLEGKLQACRAAKISQLTVITGMGNHSPGQHRENQTRGGKICSSESVEHVVVWWSYSD